jgi:hypothetical protein
MVIIRPSATRATRARRIVRSQLLTCKRIAAPRRTAQRAGAGEIDAPLLGARNPDLAAPELFAITADDACHRVTQPPDLESFHGVQTE